MVEPNVNEVAESLVGSAMLVGQATGDKGTIISGLLDAISKLKDLFPSAVNLEEIVLGFAKPRYDAWVAGDNPNIPNWLESIVEAGGWQVIEAAIRAAL